MTDQADHLRKLVRDTIETRPSLAPGLPLIAISGSDASTGISALMTDVALELVALGKRVVVVDANLESPLLSNQHRSDNRCSLSTVLSGDATVKETLCTLDDGLLLLPGNPVENAPPELNRETFNRLHSELTDLQSLADIVLVDTGNGMTPWVQNWWQAAAQIVLVTTSEERSITNAYTMVKHASRGNADNQLKLVVNQCDNEDSAARITARFAATCLRFLGVGVVESQPVPVGAIGLREYTRAVRLLASDLLSESVVSRRRVASGRASFGTMPALSEKLDYSLKHLQQSA